MHHLAFLESSRKQSHQPCFRQFSFSSTLGELPQIFPQSVHNNCPIPDTSCPQPSGQERTKRFHFPGWLSQYLVKARKLIHELPLGMAWQFIDRTICAFQSSSNPGIQIEFFHPNSIHGLSVQIIEPSTGWKSSGFSPMHRSVCCLNQANRTSRLKTASQARDNSPACLLNLEFQRKAHSPHGCWNLTISIPLKLCAMSGQVWLRVLILSQGLEPGGRATPLPCTELKSRHLECCLWLSASKAQRVGCEALLQIFHVQDDQSQWQLLIIAASEGQPKYVLLYSSRFLGPVLNASIARIFCCWLKAHSHTHMNSDSLILGIWGTEATCALLKAV